MDDIHPTESVTGRRGVAPYDLLYELHDKYEFVYFYGLLSSIKIFLLIPRFFVQKTGDFCSVFFHSFVEKMLVFSKKTW